jgi:flagellar biosynthesis protein
LTEPEIAVALRFDPQGGRLPHVSAKGRGLLAARITAIAETAGVPVRKDPDLAMILDRLDVATPIPLPAFAAVAEILAHLYCVNARLEAASGSPGSLQEARR